LPPYAKRSKKESPDRPSGLFMLTPVPFSAHTLPESISSRGRTRFGVFPMYRPPPLRGRPVLAGKRFLLIDRCQATLQVRAAVLRCGTNTLVDPEQSKWR